MGLSGTIWIKFSKFLTTIKTLDTTKITISQKIAFFNILNFYKKPLKLPFYKPINSYYKNLIIAILAKITNFINISNRPRKTILTK